MIKIGTHELTVENIVEIMREYCHGRGHDVIKLPDYPKYTTNDSGYWIFHDGEDLIVYQLTNPYAHYESADYLLTKLGFTDTDYYKYLNCGITRLFISRELSFRCGDNYFRDILYLASMIADCDRITIESHGDESSQYIELNRAELMDLF